MTPPPGPTVSLSGVLALPSGRGHVVLDHVAYVLAIDAPGLRGAEVGLGGGDPLILKDDDARAILNVFAPRRPESPSPEHSSREALDVSVSCKRLVFRLGAAGSSPGDPDVQEALRRVIDDCRKLLAPRESD